MITDSLLSLILSNHLHLFLISIRNCLTTSLFDITCKYYHLAIRFTSHLFMELANISSSNSSISNVVMHSKIQVRKTFPETLCSYYIVYSCVTQNTNWTTIYLSNTSLIFIWWVCYLMFLVFLRYSLGIILFMNIWLMLLLALSRRLALLILYCVYCKVP